MRALIAALLAGLAGSGGALAQTRADGAYPSGIFCEAGAGQPAVRERFTVTIENGRAAYAIPALRERGGGTLGAGSLTLTGSGPGYTARYAGEVGGRGGTLLGAQTRGSTRRACQLTIGDGRG